ncbi:MucR family transcriptional regulator [Mesorhizobium sp. AR07]|uniref:MucR family transcriptional regulator n=1 Tax=Mesorhizobium sp. AR07 TaxID=2865838 RepID=UPI0021609785|nr:MucR family transcriptional regulator [Mesorhizobium sp. AR07]UVK47551.1 MucR family transcriptional regulator [Mesorhizobium sp. AR07]
MTEDADTRTGEFVELTADVVAAYVQNNPVPVAELPNLIASIHSSLSGLSQAKPVEQQVQAPAVNPKKSIFPDYIISLEDGRKFKSMKRHLGLLGMTPDQYRAKWGLAKDYPMVAPNYAAQRSALAKSIGLGRKATPVKTAPAKRKAR